MRVVNDRRRLPRVAWGGNAVIQTRRGELRGVGLDLSADGMAVLAPVAGKAKEKVRIHAQLGDFPLLTDARIVRMTKRRDGYRWALRFEQMDQRMRANLEAYVRQQLANAARIRQAQLYAERLKGGGLPLPPNATPMPGPRLPTPGPQPPAAPMPASVPIDADPSQPLAEAELPHLPPGASPIELDDAPAAEPEPQLRVLEIELPDMGHAEGPALDVASTSPPSDSAVYIPYQVTDAEDEAELLGEGPLTPAPADNPPAISRAERTELDLQSPSPAPASQPTSAKTLTPGVIEIDDDEDLSLEDILAEVGGDAVEEAPAPQSDLELPPPRELSADSSGFGDVPVVDERMGDEEETRRRDTVVPGGAGVEEEPSAASPTSEEVFAKGGTLIADGAPRSLPSGEVDRTVALEGAPDDDVVAPIGGSTPTLLAGSGVALTPEPEMDIEIGGLPFGAEPDVESDEISLDAVLVEPAKPDAPALEDAPAFEDAPVSEDGLAFDGLPSHVPSLDSAILRNTAPTPPPGASGPSFAAHPSPFFDEPEPESESSPPESFSVAQSDVSTPVGDLPAELAEEEEPDPQPPAFLDEAPPAAAAPPKRTPPPSTPAPSLYADDAAPFDPYEPNPSPPEGSAQPRIGSAPRALGELPPPVSGLYTPTSNPNIREESGAYASASFEPFSEEEGLYGDRSDVTFEEQQGNPRQRLAFLQQDDRSTHSLAAQHDLFLGDIEGVTSGLTPTAYKRGMTDEDLGLGEAEEPSPDESSFRDAGVPEAAEAEPTRPVDVGPAEFTPAPHDTGPSTGPSQAATSNFTPEPEELTMEDVEFDEYYDDYEDYDEIEEIEPEPAVKVATEDAAQRGFATYPEFNVIPDYDQPLEENVPKRAGPAPAQSGRTVVTNLEELGLLPPPNEPIVRTDPTIPGDFAPIASFGGPQAPLAGFTVVAELDDLADGGPGTLSGSTMIASAEDVEAWKKAALAGKDASLSKPVKGLDEQRTAAYTPPPGTLEALDGLGATSISEHALTAMRVGRGVPSSSGAGFQLNPRGPAPAQPSPAAPSATVGRMPLAKMRVERPHPSATVPAPSRTGETIPAPSARVELPSSRPTLPPGNPKEPASAKPGPPPRRSTTLDSGGRPAPPPRPAGAQPPQAAKNVEASAAAPPATRRSLVEDALAQLKRKTEEKRKGKDRDTETKTTAEPAKPAKPAKRPRRRRLGAAELVDPAIAELYKAAMTDLDRSRD